MPDQPAVVSKNRIKTDKKQMTHLHVAANLGFSAELLTPEALEEKRKGFDHEVDVVVNWAASRVRKRMGKTAALVDLRVKGAPVGEYDQIKESWRTDGSDENAGKIFYILHGDFERDKDWSRGLEEEYMRAENLVYDVPSAGLRDKGCYEQCVTKAKGDVVRQVLGKSTASHGKAITKSLKGTRGLTPEWTKKERRQNGDFFLKSKVRTD